MDTTYKFYFADIVADNFYEIRDNFKRGLKSKGFGYDEDILSDTFISCNLALKDKLMTKEEGIKYFWTAYLNKLKTHAQQKSNTVYIDDLTFGGEIECPELDIIDETYNKDIDILYDYIMDNIRTKFGKEEADIFEMHICKGIHTKELEEMGYTNINFVYLTKKIKRYINNHIIKDNGYVKDLLKGIFS